VSAPQAANENSHGHQGKNTTGHRHGCTIFIALAVVIILALAVLSLAAFEYLRYESLISSYSSDVNAMDSAYNGVVGIQALSSQDYLSQTWLSDLDASIRQYQDDGDTAMAAGLLLVGCPLYSQDSLKSNSDWFNSSLANFTSYYGMYAKYQPLIIDYDSKVSAANAYYADIEPYITVQTSTPDFMSPSWMEDLYASLEQYNKDIDSAEEAGLLLVDCPIYDQDTLQANTADFTGSLQATASYYNAPYHTVALFDTQLHEYELYPNRSLIEITVYRGVTDPSYAQLLDFLKTDDTIDATYVPDSYVCTNFAVHLYEDAEARGMAAHLIAIDFDDSPGHMIDAFDTTDNGTVYIDDTGYTQAQISSGVPEVPESVVPVVGEEYAPQFLFPVNGWVPGDMGIISSVKRLI
jgi:hypothetical protein